MSARQTAEAHPALNRLAALLAPGDCVANGAENLKACKQQSNKENSENQLLIPIELFNFFDPAYHSQLRFYKAFIKYLFK